MANAVKVSLARGFAFEAVKTYALSCLKILLLKICINFLYEGKSKLSAKDGDKALNCMFPVNVISHPENQLIWNHCPHSACLINISKDSAKKI